MKQLPIQSDHFKYIEKSFGEWLDILGYSHQSIYQMPNYVRELFHWLETEKGINQVNQITTPLIKEHYYNLKNRINHRRTGGLSNSYLNKHLQALYKFMDYLRQTGKITLPYLAISREEKEAKAIEVLTVEEIKELYKVAENHPQTPKWEAIAARDKVLLTVFYSCGLRRNEGYYLDLSDINFDRQIIHVRKGKNYKERFVPLNKMNAKIIQEYIYDYRPFFVKDKTEEALFIGCRGTRLEGQSMAVRLKLLQQKK